MMRINDGKKARPERMTAVGRRANREAQPVDITMPGLNEKLTGPTTPSTPDNTFAIPVRVIPLLTLPSVSLGLSSSAIDSIDPKSLTESPRKQKTKEMKTPVLKENSFGNPEKKPETMGNRASKGDKAAGKRRK
jgi:hypothetical protein